MAAAITSTSGSGLKNKYEPIKYIKAPNPANKSTINPDKSSFKASNILFF